MGHFELFHYITMNPVAGVQSRDTVPSSQNKLGKGGKSIREACALRAQALKPQKYLNLPIVKVVFLLKKIQALNTISSS